jgi:glycerophosphoryl diester phosphodiesterase
VPWVLVPALRAPFVISTLLVALLLSAGLWGCGATHDDTTDAEVDADMVAPDAAWPPERERLAEAQTYDCRTEGHPPERVSTLPLGCYGDPTCEGLVVVAHRGLAYLAPQNTLSAVRAAVALGVDMVEVDVRPTADGVPVVIHDATVDSVTTATGEVSAFTLAEIQALELKVPDDLVGDFSCERIPTFRRLLRLCRDRIDVMVDLKGGPALAAAIIEAEQMLAQAIVLGSQSELEAARAAVPDLRIMIRPQGHDEIQPLWDAFVPVADVVHIDPGFDDPDTIALIHGLGAKVLMNMWGADAYALMLGDLSDYTEAYEAGVDIQQSEFAFMPLWSVGRGNPRP